MAENKNNKKSPFSIYWIYAIIGSQYGEAAMQHLDMSVKWKGETLGVIEMKRHYTNYFKGIANFKEHRMKLALRLI